MVVYTLFEERLRCIVQCEFERQYHMWRGVACAFVRYLNDYDLAEFRYELRK